MAQFQKFNNFIEMLCLAEHGLDVDQLAVALCDSEPDAENDVDIDDLSEISYANCSSRNVTRLSATQTGGIFKLLCEDLTINAAGGAVGPFRYVVLFNADSNNKLIGFYDYGADLTLKDGEQFIIDFDGANGVLIMQ
jgi:hypothetical protein